MVKTKKIVSMAEIYDLWASYGNSPIPDDAVLDHDIRCFVEAAYKKLRRSKIYIEVYEYLRESLYTESVAIRKRRVPVSAIKKELAIPSSENK